MKIPSLLLLLCGACGPALADDVQITLDFTQITAVPGQTVTFSGVVANNDLFTVDLNDISVSLNGMFMLDTTPFFSGPATVAASTISITSETPDFAMFNVTVDVPYTDPFGVQSGTLTLLGNVEDMGGYDPNVLNFLGSTPFSVDVEVPEPSPVTLFMVGAAFIFLSTRLSRAHSR
jgi:hypothetical protein